MSDFQDDKPTPDRYAQPASKDVGQLARTGAKWAFTMLILRQSVTMITTMIVSRYVSPVDTGTVAMVSTFISFLVLIDTGLTWATVQTKDLVKEQLDSLFWAGIILGAFLWLICIASGPLLAQFYDNTNLKLVSTVIGLSPFFNSLTTQPAAILKRQLKQKVNNSIETTAIIVSSLLSVVMALSAWGYWAIVAQLVCVHFLRFVLLMIFSEYKPGKPIIDHRIKPLLKLGCWLAISNYVCYFHLYFSSILMGKVFGAAALGNYTKAVGLKSLPTMYATMVVTDVMVASLAALQMDKAQMGESYRKALALTAFIGCPISAMLFPLAPEAVKLLYGSQWDMAIPMLRMLAFPAIMLPISTSTIWLFLALGKGREQLKMNIILSTATVILLLLALKFTSLPQDFVTVEALLFAIPFPLMNLYFSHCAAGISLRPTLHVIIPIIVCSILTATSLVIVNRLSVDMKLHWLILLILKSGLGGLIYLLLTLNVIKPYPIEFINNYYIGLINRCKTRT